MNDFGVRPVTQADISSLLSLVDAHADFEKMPRPSADARERFTRHLLSAPPKCEAYLASVGEKDIGYVVTYEAYTSFAAHTVLFLEDIFFLSEFRGHGFGQTLFEHLAAEAIRRGCGRMEWMVQDWNEDAIRFYRRQGGERVEGWHSYRIEKDGLQALATKADTTSQKVDLEHEHTPTETTET